MLLLFSGNSCSLPHSAHPGTRRMCSGGHSVFRSRRLRLMSCLSCSRHVVMKNPLCNAIPCHGPYIIITFSILVGSHLLLGTQQIQFLVLSIHIVSPMSALWQLGSSWAAVFITHICFSASPSVNLYIVSAPFTDVLLAHAHKFQRHAYKHE